MQKKCSDCGRQYSMDVLACLDCNEVLENSFYVNNCWAGLAIALCMHAIGLRLGWYARFTISEVIMLTAACIAVIYPAQKTYQRLRDPSRPIVSEVLSVYTDRSDRIFLLSVLVMAGWLTFGGLAEGGTGAVLTKLTSLRFWFLAYGATFFLCWSVASILDQRLAFFDLRIPNTYVHRERSRGAVL